MNKSTHRAEQISKVHVYRGHDVTPTEVFEATDDSGIIVGKCVVEELPEGFSCNTSLSTSASCAQVLGIVSGLIDDIAEKGDINALMMLRQELDRHLTKDPRAMLGMLEDTMKRLGLGHYANNEDTEDEDTEERNDADCLEEPMMLPFGGEELEDDLK